MALEFIKKALFVACMLLVVSGLSKFFGIDEILLHIAILYSFTFDTITNNKD